MIIIVGRHFCVDIRGINVNNLLFVNYQLVEVKINSFFYYLLLRTKFIYGKIFLNIFVGRGKSVYI
ncbi:hypothetical protein [Peribacillus simplex]|uniref:hypothetical protein n=1 Tax=Peribacillus simplex TaxID=1478 RepID=UPI003338EB96